MRLVDADAAIDALKEYFNDEDQKDTEYGAYWHHSHVLKVLESLPSAQPEIIRCKDCRFYQPMIDQDDLCDYRQMQVFEDDYCSRAERREDENGTD